MKTKQFTRKPFPVNAIQVTLQNVDQVAEWCGGTVELRPTKMMGTITDLPVVLLKGQGDNRGKDFEAALGCWIVELKGSFRSYKPAQFEASFDEYVEDSMLEPGDENFGHGFLQETEKPQQLSADPGDPNFDGVTFMQDQVEKNGVTSAAGPLVDELREVNTTFADETPVYTELRHEA